LSDNQAKIKGNRRRGRPPKSGAYSPICREEFLEEYPEIRRDIQGARDGLIEDRLAKSRGKTEDDLTAAERLMIDRQVSKLAVSRQIEVYLRRHGILRRDQLKARQVLEPEPILLFWLNLQNSLDRGLVALGLEPPKRGESDVLDLGRYLAEKDAEKQSQAGQGGGQASGKDSEAEARRKG
jgi:hypothetical protein